MINKVRAPTTRHVSRTHRVDLDWLVVRVSDAKSIQLMYVRTVDQLADILTHGSFTMSQLQSLLQHWQLEQPNDVSLTRSTSLKTVSCAALVMTESSLNEDGWELYILRG